jgi:beta-glucosidase
MPGGAVRATTEVRNVGNRSGDEVAQLYLNFPNAAGTPLVALRGFQRVPLKPGEARQVSFDLAPRDLSTVTPAGVRKVIAGPYRVSLGSGQPGTGVPVQSANFRVRKAATLAE